MPGVPGIRQRRRGDKTLRRRIRIEKVEQAKVKSEVVACEQVLARRWDQIRRAGNARMAKPILQESVQLPDLSLYAYRYAIMAV